MDDLRKESKYANMQDDVMEMTFVSKEVFPSACESLVDVVKKAEIRPDGLEITWLFSGDGDCLGRVLHNKALGGIIPVVYGISDDGIYEAIGEILCGKPVPATVSEPRPKDTPAYVLRFGSGGYDLASDLRIAVSGGFKGQAAKPTINDLERLPSHIKIRREGGAFSLHGRTFIEQGQVYLRHQPQWLRATDIPPTIVAPRDISATLAEQSGDWYVETSEAIPDVATILYQSINRRSEQKFSEAAARLQSANGIAGLVRLLFQLTTPDALDAYCDALIDECLPPRLEDFVQYDVDLLEERNQGIQSLEGYGVTIKAAVPSLASFKGSSLGLVLLLNNGEFPGSRDVSQAAPPRGRKPKEIAEFLTGLIVQGAWCRAGKAAPGPTFSADVLCFAVDSVMEEETPSAGLLDLCHAVTKFRARVDGHMEAMKAIATWRQTADFMAGIRTEGKFLYVRNPVSREKPRTLADFFSSARRLGFAKVHAKQNLPI